jgi:hypothetical protein
MTIASFCRDQLLAFGPLSLDELTSRALAAGVTRARNPQAALMSALRYQEVELLDGRWVTPAWLLDGRYLTTAGAGTSHRGWFDGDLDLGLLGRELLTPVDIPPHHDPDEVSCLHVVDGEVRTSTTTWSDVQTSDVAALSERVAALGSPARYGNRVAFAHRAIAQLMVDDPTTFRTPLPPLSSWVPALVEEVRSRTEQLQRRLEWEEEEARRRRREVILSDCEAVEVEIAAARAGLSVSAWVYDALDRALEAEHQRVAEPGGIVISLGDRWLEA